MNDKIGKFLSFVADADWHDKAALTKRAVEEFRLVRDRSVYYCDYFAVRFCQTKNGSFSNTVLSLSSLQKYDSIPFFVVLVGPSIRPKVFLANSTFINKISHSSQQLSETNIKGSFNGSDILKKPFGVDNNISNVDRLFPFHREVSWAENLQRLVQNTTNIIPRGSRLEVNEKMREAIISSIDRAQGFVSSDGFGILKSDLDDRVALSAEAIICASRIENVNIRGRLIESLITSDPQQREILARNLRDAEKSLPVYDTANKLGDYCVSIDGLQTYTDIKTKIVYLDSNPKAYNIDKFLEVMSHDDSVFFFYFIGIDAEGVVNKILCSVYDKRLIENTVIQFHWAGRNSRGVTQFIGTAIDAMLSDKNFVNVIDRDSAISFIDRLISARANN
ncbi:MAG: hypothetical protein NC117_05880 [Pseudoflavonifractor sp.]|nr:hypothetical protein [Pseudoflavonifractor sp.]